MKLTTTLVLTALLALPAHAQFLENGTLTKFSAVGDYYGGGADNRGHIYIIPNELNPEAASGILEQGEPGAYVSVGAERGLMGALMATQVTHVVQIDLVPEVVRYNQLNVILLKVSKSLPEYLALRQAGSEVWSVLSSDNALNEAERSLLTDTKSNEFFRSVEAPARERLTDKQFFIGSSFLKEPLLFERARTMARAGRIQVIQGSLTDHALLRNLSRDLSGRGIKVSLLDLSNAWEAKYVGPHGVSDVLLAMKPALTKESIIMGTSVRECFESHRCLWDFRAYTVELLDSVRGIMGTRFSFAKLYSKKRSPEPGILHTGFDSVQPSITLQAGVCRDVFLAK